MPSDLIESLQDDSLNAGGPPHSPSSWPAQSTFGAGAGAGGDPVTPEPQDLRQRPKVRLHAKGAAMTVELDPLPEDTSRGGLIYPGRPFWTLRVELAGGLPGTGGRRFDWANKVALQLTPSELPLFVATVMRWAPDCVFTNHGTARNKSLRVENQDGKIYFAISEGGDGHAMPVADRDRYGLSMLCAIALQRNHPDTGAQLALNMIKQLYSSSSYAPRANRAA